MFEKLFIPEGYLEEALGEICQLGLKNKEGFALFLGQYRVTPLIVSKAYIPDYVSDHR